MKTNQLLIIAVIAVVFAACGAGSKKSTDMEKRTQVKIETTLGNIVVELYNETPKHRNNFIKLAKEGVYDSTLFHRVIKAFMIQAGDPDPAPIRPPNIPRRWGPGQPPVDDPVEPFQPGRSGPIRCIPDTFPPSLYIMSRFGIAWCIDFP